MELEFEGKRFKIEKKELAGIAKQACKELLAEENKKGVISSTGLVLRVASCFACGSHEDYSGKCRYESKVRVIVGSNSETLCKRDDISVVYAIKLGKLKQYEI